tara:strand:- start:108 stop:1172 length:1065 start_codon:yes stop_codon:yes gene_type:complete
MPLSKIQNIGNQVVPNLGRRNLIINGSMEVAQRGTSSTSTGYQTVDRFSVSTNALDELAFTQAQVDDVPAGTGLKKSFKFTVTTAESALASDEFVRIYHAVEGKNLQRFEWGTSTGKEVTVSFYVKSSITGTFACSIYIFDANVIMNKPYTISSANTWERKTLTFPAYTAGGSTPADDTSPGIYLNFGLLAGSSYNTQINDWTAYGSGANLLGGQTANVGAVNSTTWQLTGVQLEVGSTATDFEQLTFAEELQLCQRYYQQITHHANDVIRGGYGLTAEYWQVQLPVQMRAAPSSSLKSGTVAYSNCSSFLYYTNANNTTNNTVTAFVDPNDNTYFYLYPTSAADLVWQFIAEM